MKDLRYKQIINLIKEKGFVKIKDLCDEFNVVPLTIRRDLIYLEKQGILLRVHGGAFLKENNILSEMKYIDKKQKNNIEKEYIAKIASKFIVDNDIIFIGPGSTVEKILKYIHKKNITVITNSISIIKKYSHLENIEFIIIGGALKKSTQAIIPDLFTDVTNRINVNKAFIGTNGIYEDKITYSDRNEGKIEEAMIANSIQSYILSDSSKFDKKAFFSLLYQDKITAIITDDKINKNTLKKYNKYFKIINKSHLK